MRAKFGVLEQTYGIRIHAKFRLDWFILSPSGGKNPKFCCFFGLWHFVVSQLGSNLSDLNMCAQLQTFPYAKESKSFLYSNAFMAKSGAQSLTFKSVTDRQTDRQKTQRFWPPRRRVTSEPHQTWHGDRGPREGSCTLKHLGSDA